MRKPGRTAKITQEIADEIRRLWKPNPVSYKSLSKQFGLGMSTLQKLLSGKTWKKSAEKDPKD